MKLKDPPVDLVVPQEIEIRLSNIDNEKMGLWCKKAIKKGSRFGPFIGEKALEVDDRMDPTYIWEIVDVETKEFLFYINATDPRRCNWMRYINCARFFEEQNILSEQDGIDIFYQAIKDIEPGEELLTWYEKTPLRKRKGKRRTVHHVRRAKTTPGDSTTTSAVPSSDAAAGDAPQAGASISQRGRRRSAKKYWQIEETADPREAAEAAGELYGANDVEAEVSNTHFSVSDVAAELADDEKLDSSGRYFQFELLPVHTGSRNRLGRKMFECDVCAGVYRHGFSLKRHYLRNHINRRYISRVDALNCNLAFCGDNDDEKTPETGHPRGHKRPKVERGSVKSEAVEGPTRVATASSESGCSTSRSGDDGATLQMDVEEIDAGAETPDSTTSTQDGEKPRRAANDFPALYRCYVCERHFDTVDELKSHVCDSKAASRSDKRFSCRHCQMQFRHRQNLVRHELVHTGAKPFTCEKCNKCFPTLTNRRRHERIHGGCRLACSLCASSFTQTGDLKKHIRRQHPESYRACAFCSRYFTADAQLSVHLRRAHPGADLDANRRHAGARRDARCAALEADRAESRRLGAAASPANAADQFACTVCCKNFADYANMCRHRRLAHGCGVRGIDPDASSTDGDESQGGATASTMAGGTSAAASQCMDAQQAYFANVTQNIAANLNNHVEGKAEHLSRAGSHIRWRQGTGDSSSSNGENSGQIRLEEFNFPRGFRILTSSELCRLRSNVDKRDTSPTSKDLAVKNSGPEVDQDHWKDPVLISVPDVRKCPLCRMVFHSSMSLEQHMADHHQHRTAVLTVSTSSPPPDILSSEKPLDLSSPVAKASETFQLPDVPHLLVEMAEPLPAERSASKNRKVVCLVCFREYGDSDELLRHQAERHPNIDCRHIEVDDDFQSADVGLRPRAVGLLNVSSSQLPALPDEGGNGATSSSEVICTKCRQNFATRSALHAHIVDCGDYWRSLSDRLTWVFVLRGSELPAPPSGSTASSAAAASRKQQGRRRGKFRWGSASSQESMKRQMQRMLIKQHVGSSGSGAGSAESRRASTRVLSRRNSDSPPLGDAVSGLTTASRDNRKQLQKPPQHALRRHMRRRAAAAAASVSSYSGGPTGELAARCDRCDVALDTAADRDSHETVCSNRGASATASEDRNAEARDNDDDDDIDPAKHLCIYCNRQFTFLRALRRHVIDGCSVRRDLVERQEYVDSEWEAQLTALASVGRTSTGGSTDVTEDVAADAAGTDGLRRSGSKRRRRCKNWGNTKSKSRKSARSSGDDADDSLFGWEDAYMSTWGKDERDDITQRDGDQRSQCLAKQSVDVDTAAVNLDVKTTALARLLTTDITLNVSDRQTRTSSDDLDAFVPHSVSTSASTNSCPINTASVDTTDPAVTTITTPSTGTSFAVKLELITESADNDDKTTSLNDVEDQSHPVADVVLVVDEILKNDDNDVGEVGLDSSGTSSSFGSDAGPSAVHATTAEKQVNDEMADDDGVTDDVTNDGHSDDVSNVSVNVAEVGDDSSSRFKSRRRRTRRLTMTKRKRS